MNGCPRGPVPRRGRSARAFTLAELLVVVGIIALLIAILLPSLARAQRLARATACASQMKQIAVGTLMYAQDHGGRWPRSTHSALPHRVMPWGYALSPYLGSGPYTGPSAAWDKLFTGLYRCPEDDRAGRWSYGKNVWFELNSAEVGEIDGVASGPTYTRVSAVPRPSATVLYGELGSGSMADHVMAHFWYLGGAPEVDASRHGKTSNYAYADGHVASGTFGSVFRSPTVDQWHPGRAK